MASPLMTPICCCYDDGRPLSRTAVKQTALLTKAKPTMPDPISPATLAALQAIDTPTICNVIELFEIQPRHTGYMNARIRANFPEMPAIVGFAATVTCRCSSPPAHGGDGYSSLDEQAERFAELSGPPIIVMQDLDEPQAAATFGEVMCSSYQRFGALGLISSGAGRDLDQVRALGFPVWTDGTIASHGYFHLLQTHVPVQLGGCVVAPDDLVHADANGVSLIPRAIASEIPDVAPQYLAAEEIVLSALKQESLTPAQLGDARRAMGAAIQALSARLQR